MRFVALMSGCLVAMLAVAGGASASTLAVNQAVCCAWTRGSAR